MPAEQEFGKCEMCNKDAYLNRKYFEYALKCKCHSPQHFELIKHCNECKPMEPAQTTYIPEDGTDPITVNTNTLIKLNDEPGPVIP